MKVLFLNTRKKRIDCGTLMRLGRSPDVVILAELLKTSQKNYEEGLRKVGLGHCSRPTLYSRKRHVRVYSKLELETDERFSRQGNKLKNNWVRCRIAGIIISAVHMPTQGMKKKAFAQLKPWMRRNADRRALMVGDFNTDPSKDKKWGPTFASWLEHGWRNLWDKVPAGKDAHTFQGTRKSDKPRRIDHAFAG